MRWAVSAPLNIHPLCASITMFLTFKGLSLF
uniref:Uncharacterized protein n=1 Tax=Arundo donax TaxID=35708 RepID=A0A0A9GT62_ARUDO